MSRTLDRSQGKFEAMPFLGGVLTSEELIEELPRLVWPNAPT